MNDVSFEADGFEDQRSVLPVRTPLVSRTAARKKQWRRGLFAFAAACLVGTCAQGQTSFGTQNVGVSSAAQSVTVTAQVAGQVSTVEVLTLGTSGLDFAPGSGGATCASANLMAGQSCTQSITFTPTSPGQRNGAVVLLNSGGGVLDDCPTLQEAVMAWHRLAPEQKKRATVKVFGGPLYIAEEIERLHYGHKPRV